MPKSLLTVRRGNGKPWSDIRRGKRWKHACDFSSKWLLHSALISGWPTIRLQSDSNRASARLGTISALQTAVRGLFLQTSLPVQNHPVVVPPWLPA